MKGKTLVGILLGFVLIFNSGCKEEEIGEWIIGTWSLDKYTQETFEAGQLTGSSESLDQGQVIFNEGGTGDDLGGNFIGSTFEWSHTNTTLKLTMGANATVYDIDIYSTTDFVFSRTEATATGENVETWYMSK